METCEKSNASSEIAHKKQQMRRSVDDLMRLHEETKRKQRMIAEAERQRELQEATFAPQINALSAKVTWTICRRWSERGSCSVT